MSKEGKKRTFDKYTTDMAAMKILLAQQNYHIGNFEANTEQILRAMAQGAAMGADLVVFSELAVCGYPPRDFLEFPDFVAQCGEALNRIAAASTDVAVLVGCPSVNPEPGGKHLMNSAYLCYDGAIRGVAHKTLLPNYDIFDEYRYFEPAYSWGLLQLKGRKLAVTICEDLWNVGNDPMYRTSPMEQLIKAQPDIIINLSASPFNYLQAASRLDVLTQNAQLYGLPIIYCNTVGAQTELVFDGGSLAMNADGSIAARLPQFAEAMQLVSWEADGQLYAPDMAAVASAAPVTDKELVADQNIADIHLALLVGIRDYFAKMGFERAIVASSGGIDSAVTLALACEALGADKVHALLLPSQFSTDHSVADAIALSTNLGNRYDLIPIAAVFDTYQQLLQPVFKDAPFGLAEENLQSRIRGAMVMALANKFGYILLNTSNKSELATGYGTLYGDMAGGLAVLGDLYKVQVYALANYINRDKPTIPTNIITKAPSAELRPGQKDSDSLPVYELLDPILYQYIERRQGHDAIVAQGHDAALVGRTLRMVNNNEYKRNQFCPIIRVSPKAFGVGRRMPIVGKYETIDK